MEFPDLGEHCSLLSCKQLDFLPFTCDACHQVFCKDHLKYDAHQCRQGQSKDRRVPVCPLCNQPVSISANESVDHKVNEHIENDCKSDLAKHKRSNRCNVKGCKQHMLVPILCASCKRNYCLRHRHENDHNCTKTSSSGSASVSKQSAASIPAGQAAAQRYSPKHTVTKPKPPQTSTLSSIGSDLNRSRNERYQSSATQQPRSFPSHAASSGLQGNMSEDQALALALQASLNETTFQPEPAKKEVPKTLSCQEREDLELAHALQQSEKEERERNRRKQQEDSSKKDNCVLS